MTSTETNNNSVSSTQPVSFSFTGSKTGSSSPQLASLANATEPTNFLFNSQQPPVATFPQRLSGETGTSAVYFNSYENRILLILIYILD